MCTMDMSDAWILWYPHCTKGQGSALDMADFIHELCLIYSFK